MCSTRGGGDLSERASGEEYEPERFPLILATGPLVAAIDADDRDNDRCAPRLAHGRERRAVPPAVLAELDSPLIRELGPGQFPTFADTIMARDRVGRRARDSLYIAMT